MKCFQGVDVRTWKLKGDKPEDSLAERLQAIGSSRETILKSGNGLEILEVSTSIKWPIRVS